MSVNENMIMRTLVSIKNVEEKFARIQENPALHGAEDGLTAQEIEILEKLIAISGEAMLAAEAISKRFIGE